jgi:hypothetical protein
MLWTACKLFSGPRPSNRASGRKCSKSRREECIRDYPLQPKACLAWVRGADEKLFFLSFAVRALVGSNGAGCDAKSSGQHKDEL